MTFEQGERLSLASQQRPCLLSAAAAADIGGGRVWSRQSSLRTYLYAYDIEVTKEHYKDVKGTSVPAIHSITTTTSGPHSLRARSDFYKLTKTKFNEKTINLKQTY